MARIRIEDITVDLHLTEEQVQQITGGNTYPAVEYDFEPKNFRPIKGAVEWVRPCPSH